jgi:nucleotide-binding universal stress UspA family protein
LSPPGVTNIEKTVESGPVARTVVEAAKEQDVDMIVIGSRGLGNIEATLRGGVSRRVELLVECSVLTVK